MPETPTPLDLGAIRARSDARRDYADERPESLHDPEHYAALADESAADVPALVAEVERLRAEVDRLTTRPAPAWDEEAVAEAVRKDLEAVGILPWTNGGARIVRTVLAVVREHLPVKPSREEVARALALVGDYDGCFERLDAWAAASSEARECGDVEEPMSTDGEDAEWWLKRADAVLSLLPGRSEAGVKAEALRGFAARVRDEMDASDKALGTEWATGEYRHAMRSALMQVDEEADRLAAEGGAS